MQSLPRSAESYGLAQRREIAAALLLVRRYWRQMTSDFDTSWIQIEAPLAAAVTASQARLAAGALAYVPAVLEETGQARAVAPFASTSAAPLVGAAGDGRAVRSLLYGAVTNAKTLVGQGVAPAVALTRSRSWLTMATGTVLSDTGRQAESLAMGVRPVSGYVRMLNPPSCSRCAVLAGRWYRKSVGFQRHPGCDCRHIPASESLAGELTVDTRAYFDSLDGVEQERIFTVDGAAAIREGADINQVVNARRGMTTSQSGRLVRDGNGLYSTTEGTTRRGYARAVTGRERGFTRLMPESIAQIATDRDDYLRLLRINGYL